MILRPMYTSNQIAAGAFFGGPVASTIMMRANFLALNDVIRARKTAFYGLLGTFAIFLIAFCVPQYFPKLAIPVTYTTAFQIIAKQFGMQKTVFMTRNMEIRSNWQVAGLSVLWFTISAVAFMAILFIFLFAKAVFTHH